MVYNTYIYKDIHMYIIIYIYLLLLGIHLFLVQVKSVQQVKSQA